VSRATAVERHARPQRDGAAPGAVVAACPALPAPPRRRRGRHDGRGGEDAGRGEERGDAISGRDGLPVDRAENVPGVPAVAAEQSVLQAEPGTVATTVTASVAPSVVTIAEVVEALARMFTLLHAGTICWVPGAGATAERAALGWAQAQERPASASPSAVFRRPARPLSEKKQAK